MRMWAVWFSVGGCKGEVFIGFRRLQWKWDGFSSDVGAVLVQWSLD